MARKTYRTYRLRGLQVFVKDENGKPLEINFRGGIQIDSTAKFTTSDKALQEKLEALDVFGKSFYIESVEAEEPKADAPKEKEKVVAESTAPKTELTDVKDIKRFHNIVEMRSAMAELGFKGVQEMNYAQLKSAAGKEGYDFQIQK